MEGCYIGTSGFSYADWRGPFYPESLAKEEFLPYYAERFPFVELNFTYYRQPSARAVERMIEKTPDSFLFTVKAHKSLTHERETDEGGGQVQEAAVQSYLEGIRPLLEGERLGGILLQFPYSFHYNAENRSYLAALCDSLSKHGPLPLLIEFRNAEWSGESVIREFESRGMGSVVTDQPKLKNLPEGRAVITGKTAYFRLHGRNKENWWTGDSTGRYDYLYRREELKEFLPLLRELSKNSSRLFIAFNNHYKGQAVENAFLLKKLIEEKV
jgi:uncharacterized protein YecE (DUF72 family)